MRVFIRTTAVVAAAMLFSVITAAQQPAPQAPQRRAVARPGQLNRQIVSQRPQLTEQQREQMRAFDEQQRSTAETTRRELGELHRQLNEALTEAQVDGGKVNQLRAAIVQKETALAQHRLDRMAKLSSVLTAEQRQALRGRGLGEVFGPGGAGGRGGMVARPRAPRGARDMRPGGGRGMTPPGALRQRIAPRQPRVGQPGQLRGGGGRGAAVGRDAANEARLRAEIRRLEAQLEALRRRIR